MKRLLFIILVFVSFVSLSHGQSIFQRTFGTINYEEIYGLDITANNGFILAGYSGFGTFGYVIKLDGNGDTIWTKKIVAGGFDLLYTIEQTTDNGFITGGRTSGFGAGAMDMLVIKLDSNGNNLWTKAIGEYEDETVNDIQQTMDNGYIIAGGTYSYTPGLNDFYLVKLNSVGSVVWTKSIGGTQNDNAYAVALSPDSGYVAVGLTGSAGAGGIDILAVKLDKTGNVVWMKTYGDLGDDRANSIQPTTDGGFIIAASTKSYGAGDYDFNLIKIDSIGNLIWSKTYGGIGQDRPYSVQQTNDNGYIVTGHTNSFGFGSYDYYLIKTNSFGDTTWAYSYGDTGWDVAKNVRQTSDNGYAIIGLADSFADSTFDFYFLKTDIGGNTVCHQNTTGTIVTSPTPIVTVPLLTVGSTGFATTTSPTITSGTTIKYLCTDAGIQNSESANSNYRLYPNPFHVHAILSFENDKNINCTLRIYNMYGQNVGIVKDIISDEIQIERGILPNGLYSFRLNTDSKILATGRFIIE